MNTDKNNTQVPQYDKTAVMRCCSICQHFQYEEAGDSEHGVVYADEQSCMKYFDTDEETEEEIPNFDRKLVRDCCDLDFWKVLDKDNDLIDLLNLEGGKMDKAYDLFKVRYNNA